MTRSLMRDGITAIVAFTLGSMISPGLAHADVKVVDSPQGATDFKCGVPNAVIFVDGELSNEDRLLQLRGTDAVYALRVACWSPRDSSFSVMGPGIPFYEVLTETFVENITTRLAAVQQAQRAYVARHGSFSTDLGELGVAHIQADGLEIVLTADAGGWTATATRERMVHRCSVAGGALEREGGDGTPSCVFDMTRKVALPRG
jgi:hypothetical protein